jgi:hypothetical protein
MLDNQHRWLYGLLGLLFIAGSLSAQQATDCDPLTGQPVASGEVLFNYGSATNAFSFSNRSDFTIGQPLVGRSINQNQITEYGFWARFLLPPQAPRVLATQGNFIDRIQISWSVDPLSAKVTDGYIIKRNGSYLDEVDSDIEQYIDFNVQAGEFYEYSIQGRNRFGTGRGGTNVGFVNPNGLVTGQITTSSGNPVAGATVTLEPTIGRSLEFNGVSDYLCLSYDEALPTDMFTFSAWVKIGDGNDRGGIIDLGSNLHKNFWLHTTAAGDDKGIIAGVGDGTTDYEYTVTFDDDADGWHQVAMVYSAGSMILYLDGMYNGAIRAPIDTTATLFHMGSDYAQTNYFKGKLDDVRIYNRPLTQTELLLTKDITVSSNTPDLVAYWKFDEGRGKNAFDLTDNEVDATIEGATFSTDAAAVLNAGRTDASGYYFIEGINYSEAQTFQVEPSKNFYNHASLEFNAAYEAYADLTTFDLPDTATIELSVQPFDTDSRQTLLNQEGVFELFIEGGSFKLTLNGDVRTLGPATDEFQYLALTMDGTTNEVNYYLNGDSITTLTGWSMEADYGVSPWRLGAGGSNGAPNNFFTGLIDEVAFFSEVIDLPTLQLHASPLANENTGVNSGEGNLLVHFPLDEGQGTEIEDYGPMMTGMGTVSEATFSIMAFRQVTRPHEFRPSRRVVNLTNSSTAVSNVDFIDESTVTISGVVRFSNTFCFQDSVELLVNGFSNVPAIYTDNTGKFVGDFEPGASIILTPRYADTTHKFMPTFFEARRINRPIAGRLFQNTTKREVSGQIAGGVCRLSINDPMNPIGIKIAALNSCYEQELQVTALDGTYEFRNLPPIPMAVSITYHPTPAIYNDFQDQGAPETDLRRKGLDTIDFIYTSTPLVELDTFAAQAGCDNGLAFIEQSTPENRYREYSLDARVYELYKDARCYLDSFSLTITNDIADAEPYSVTVTDTTVYPINFFAGIPRIAGDYAKLIEVVGTTNAGTDAVIERVVVLGERSRESTFTTTSPTAPMIVLRDPPGDGSSATLAESSQRCFNWSNASMSSSTSTGALNVDLGAKVVTYAGTPFGGIIMESEQTLEVDISGSIGAVTGMENTAEFCVTVDRSYSTSDGDDVLGQDADLYVGAAINFELSTTDVLKYDYDNCVFILGENTRTWPDGFGTKYVYSEWQILTDVIPTLEQIQDTLSANAWRRIIAQNEEAKNSAVLVENITFDALNTLTVSQESSSSTSSSFTHEFIWTAGMASTIGFEVFDVGSTITLGFDLAGSTTNTNGSSGTDATTVSYTLADDDTNDNWTIDILDDGVFGTPVFKVRAGESMCPWEPNTLNREQVAFATDIFTDVNVPANEAAIYNLVLTNDSQTGNDALVYVIGPVPGTNPDGATITADGSTLSSPRPYQILPGENLEVLLTIKRGPLAYNYDSIGIFMASQCMLEHSESLGYDLSDQEVTYDRFENIVRQGIYDPSDLSKFYKELRLGAQFLEPCSPIDILFPMQDFVVTPTENNQVTITLFDYIFDDPELSKVRVQYRRTGGDGSWNNIVELDVSEFADNPNSKNVTWNMEELQDGPYDIRAVTECFDLALNAGISTVIKGRKETRPPQLFGTPQPADGVLSPGDEISITFTKRIQCDQIFQADVSGSVINVNNLALIDATTGLLIDAIITCSGDKIIIVPNIQNQFIENRTLRVVTNGIMDFYGNETDEIAWEFFVNRSNLYWDGGAIDEMVDEGESIIVSREIRNQGGAITSFTIPNVPDWMQVFPRSGVVAPGERLTVNFEVPADLLPDTYNYTIIMETVDGDEPLEVEFRVLCDGPVWSFDATQYSQSMNLTVELDIEGEISNDRVDRIGAFINGQLRGVANVEYKEALETDNGSINPYLAFLTVYGEDVNTGVDTVRFRIWDASACELYGSTLESFAFEPNGLIGQPLLPQTIHTNNQVLRKIYINPGWNWISYNVDLDDPSTDAFLETLTNQDVNSIIKGQAGFSQYTPELDRWLGTVNELSNLTMYQLRVSQYDSITLVGRTIDPTLPIPVSTGWNWVGYLPSRGLAVTDALSSLTPLNGDIVKGQFAFAQYVAGIGWIGNLSTMSSPNGYQLRLSNPAPDTLVYPDPNVDNLISPGGSLNKFTALTGMKSAGSSPWEVNAQNYEFSMNIVAVVKDSLEGDLLAEGDAIGAFVNGEVRGSGDVLYVEELDLHLVFLTVYANEEGELIDFKFYNSSRDDIGELNEDFSFQINEIMGTVAEPQVFHLPGLLSSVARPGEQESSFRAFPNPATDKVFLSFSAVVGEDLSVEVYNVYGQVVNRIQVEAPDVENLIEWTPEELPPGIYTLILRREKVIETLKVVLQ